MSELSSVWRRLKFSSIPHGPNNGRAIIVRGGGTLELERHSWLIRARDAYSGERDQPFRLKVITDTGDRDHAVSRAT